MGGGCTGQILQHQAPMGFRGNNIQSNVLRSNQISKGLQEVLWWKES